MSIDRLLDKGIINTYNLITVKLPYDEILSKSEGPGGGTVFFVFPEDEPDNEDIDTMIDYFISVEEYEKCSILKKLKK